MNADREKLRDMIRTHIEIVRKTLPDATVLPESDKDDYTRACWLLSQWRKIMATVPDYAMDSEEAARHRERIDNLTRALPALKEIAEHEHTKGHP